MSKYEKVEKAEKVVENIILEVRSYQDIILLDQSTKNRFVDTEIMTRVCNKLGRAQWTPDHVCKINRLNDGGVEIFYKAKGRAYTDHFIIPSSNFNSIVLMPDELKE